MYLPKVAARSEWLLKALIVLSLAVPLCLLAYVGWQSREQALQKAAEDTRQAVDMLHEHALKVFETQDLVLHQIDRSIVNLTWPEIERDERLHRTLRAIADQSGAVTTIWLADNQAQVRASSDMVPPGLTAFESEHVSAHESTDVGTFIGAPFAARTSGATAFAVSRRRKGPRGTFDGTIHAAVKSGYFENFWRGFAERGGLDAAITLIRSDGTVLARFPGMEVKEQRPLLADVIAYLAEHGDAGTVTDHAGIDGVDRIFSYRKLAGLPVYVSYSVGRDAVLTRWRGDMVRETAFALTAIAALGILGGCALRYARRRAEAEADVQRTQRELARVLESTSDNVFMLDREWRLTYANSRAANFVPGRKLLGEKFTEILPRVVDSVFWQAYQTAMRDRAALDVEGYSVLLDRWFEARVHPLGDGIAVFLRDITDRKLAEQELRQSEERFRLAIRAAACAVWEWDIKAGTVALAGLQDGWLGYDESQLDGTFDWWAERIHPDERESVLQHVTDSIGRREEVFEATYRFRTADGSYAHIIDRGYTQFDEAGEPLRTIGAMLDMTVQQRIEQELRHTTTHLARAQRIASVGSWEYDARSGSLRWSEEVYRLGGLEPGSVEPNPDLVLSMLHPEDREAVERSVRRTVEEGLSDFGECRIVRRNGEVRIALRQTEPLRDPSGKVIGVLGTIQDVTDLRAAEQKRRELEAQLLQAQKMEALGTLAGGIAHDLNNTLTPILMLTGLVAQQLPADSRPRKDLAVVEQAAKRARDLVRQILAFSRKQDADKRWIDLGETLRSSMPMLRAMLLPNVALVLEAPPVPSVFADPTQVHQILLNLISNAAHAIGSAQGRITIALEHAPGQGSVSLHVTDTGSGMDKAVLDRLFDPFFTTKPVDQGSGLGLSVVHGIVSNHGGRISVESAPGRGARMTIELPTGIESRPTGKVELQAPAGRV